MVTRMNKNNMQVRYIGVCGSVVDVPGFGVFEKDVDVEVSLEIGKQLLKRGDFIQTKHWTQEWKEMKQEETTEIVVSKEVKEHG
jgi:hypothetical protein